MVDQTWYCPSKWGSQLSTRIWSQVGTICFCHLHFFHVLHSKAELDLIKQQSGWIPFVGDCVSLPNMGMPTANANGLYCWPEPSLLHYRILLAMSKTCVPALPNSVGNSLYWVPVLLKWTRITYPEFLSELQLHIHNL